MMEKITRRAALAAIPVCGLAPIVPVVAAEADEAQSARQHALNDAMQKWADAHRHAIECDAKWKSAKSAALPGLPTPEGNAAWTAQEDAATALDQMLRLILRHT